MILNLLFGAHQSGSPRARRSHATTWLSFAFTAALAACGSDASEGKAAVGEACTQRGRADECVPGAVCDTVKDNRVVCLKTCERDEDCTPPDSCSGISGTTGKACHPK